MQSQPQTPDNISKERNEVTAPDSTAPYSVKSQKEGRVMKTVLLLENDNTMRSIVSFALKEGSYEVHEALDLDEAVRKLEKGLRPDIAITAVSTPGIDGTSLVRGIRSYPACNNIPILMLATERMLHKQMEWKEAGATCWILKPFTAGQLMEMVNMVSFHEGFGR